MSDWNKLSETKPAANQMCWITGGEFEVIKLLPWNETANGFLDLFATYEAGALYGEGNGVTHWLPEESIPVPQEAP